METDRSYKTRRTQVQILAEREAYRIPVDFYKHQELFKDICRVEIHGHPIGYTNEKMVAIIGGVIDKLKGGSKNTGGLEPLDDSPAIPI